MKAFITTCIAILVSISIFSQAIIEETLAIKNSRDVDINFDFADQIIIKKWDKTEAFVKVVVNINDNEDNDKFNLELSESSGKINITGEIDDMENIGQSQTVIHHGEIFRNDSHCIRMEIDCEIFLPESSGITVETISGDVEIIGFSAPLKVNSISGFVDISINNSTKADVIMETVTGEFYSDLDLERIGTSEWKHHWIGGKLESKLNGGGHKINLETVSGNIYLRKL